MKTSTAMATTTASATTTPSPITSRHPGSASAASPARRKVDRKRRWNLLQIDSWPRRGIQRRRTTQLRPSRARTAVATRPYCPETDRSPSVFCFEVRDDQLVSPTSSRAVLTLRSTAGRSEVGQPRLRGDLVGRSRAGLSVPLDDTVISGLTTISASQGIWHLHRPPGPPGGGRRDGSWWVVDHAGGSQLKAALADHVPRRMSQTLAPSRGLGTASRAQHGDHAGPRPPSSTPVPSVRLVPFSGVRGGVRQYRAARRVAGRDGSYGHSRSMAAWVRDHRRQLRGPLPLVPQHGPDRR